MNHKETKDTKGDWKDKTTSTLLHQYRLLEFHAPLAQQAENNLTFGAFRGIG